MNTISHTVTASPGIISPIDALWTLIQGQTKAVRTALLKRLIDEEQSVKVEQEYMVKKSLTKAFDELHAGKAKHNARALFSN